MELTNKTIAKLERERAKENEKLAALTAKRDELDTQIKAVQESVKDINTNIRQEKILMIAKAADKKGFDLDDVYAMFADNDKKSASAPAPAAESVTDDTAENGVAETTDTEGTETSSYEDADI